MGGLERRAMIIDRNSRVLMLIAGLFTACGPKNPSGEDSESSGQSTSETEPSTSETGISATTDGESTSSSPTTTTEGGPESCLPGDVDDASAAYGKCEQYLDVKTCCGAKLVPTSPDSEDSGTRVCAKSFDTKKDETSAPVECPQLVGEAFDCSLAVAAESCGDLRDLVEAVWETYDQSDGWRPPADMSMPCFVEIMAAWNGGCEPYML